MFASSIRSQFLSLLKSPPLDPIPYLPIPRIPRQLVFLATNALTQYVCIRGVNILGSVSSALTVTIVLNVRKLVSLIFSIWLFGNVLGSGVLLGAAVVFVGGLIYGLESQRQSQIRRQAAAATASKAE